MNRQRHETEAETRSALPGAVLAVRALIVGVLVSAFAVLVLLAAVSVAATH